VVVEHHQPLREMAGEHEFDGIVEEVDARRDDHRLCLGGDGPQRSERCAGLEGDLLSPPRRSSAMSTVA